MTGPRLGPSVLAAWAVTAGVFAGCLSAPINTPMDFVSSVKYSRLVLEVDYAEGYQPRTEAVDLIKQRIEERLSKPQGTTVEMRAFSSAQSTYSVEDLRSLEAERRDRRPGGDAMVLYVLYLNGRHEEDSGEGRILGVHYDHASIAIFKDSIDRSGGLLGLNLNAADVEKAVLVHEFGHAIGLVNNGLEMQRDHEDEDHPKHSSNQESVMYWAVENTLGLPGLDRIPNNFDPDDVADTRAAGGK